MKMTAKLVLAAAIGASMCVVCAWGQEAASAQSVNAVGVVKYTVPKAGGLVCISLPLNTMGEVREGMEEGDWVFNDISIFNTNQFPKGGKVYFWNTNSLAWDPFGRAGRTGAWGEDVTNRIVKAREAFFVQSPENSTEDLVLSLLGELPVESTLSYDVTGSGNLDIIGVSPYPVSVAFTNTPLYGEGEGLAKGSSVYLWHTNAMAWDPLGRTKRTGEWSEGLLQKTINVGEGAFIQSAGEGATYTTTRPFDWE